MLDAREYALTSVNLGTFLNKDGQLDHDRSINGPWSAGIPGLPAALVELAEHYGKLPLRQTLAPAIRIASAGFPVYRRMVEGYQSRREVMERYPGTREVYLRGGKPMDEGDIFKQPELARTLLLLANKGFDGFYKGETAQRLLAGVNRAGDVGLLRIWPVIGSSRVFPSRSIIEGGRSPLRRRRLLAVSRWRKCYRSWKVGI